MTTLITVLDLEVAGASASSGTPFDAGLVRLAWPVGGGDAGTFFCARVTVIRLEKLAMEAVSLCVRAFH